MSLIFVTRRIPEVGLNKMRDAGHQLVVSEKDGVLTISELKNELSKRPYDGVISLLTDTVNMSVLEVAPSVKIVANYAVGHNNIALDELSASDIVVTNTPGVLTDTVAEYTVALMLTVTKRIAEADRFTRDGKFSGWAPELLLGSDLSGKTLGIVGAGRIGTGVAKRMQKGFGMKVCYCDISQSETFESEVNCDYSESLEDLLKNSDVVSIHVPLLPQTKYLINSERLRLMKKTAYLINTSRGPVVDEIALVEALKNKIIKGAGLDVFEKEPILAEGLNLLENVVLTPHIASASEETRDKMSELVAENIISFFTGETPPHVVRKK